MTINYESPVTGDTLIWDIWLSQHYLPAVTSAGEIGLWERLGNRALTLDELATELDVRPMPLGVLLSLLCPLGFVVRREDRYQLTQVSRTYLDPASAFFWGPILFGSPIPSPIHERLIEMLRRPADDAGQAAEGSAARGWESGQMEIEQARHIASFMHAHSSVTAIGAARSGVFDGVQRLMDVGGGSGVYSIAAAQRYPELRTTILELPAMCEAAQAFIDAGGVAGRVAATPVDMWREPWPVGHDALFFSNIFHDWNIEQNTELAAKAFAALPSGGRIILHEQLMNDAQDGPLTTASFSVLMLRGTSGKQYSLPEFRGILEAAGFTAVEAWHSCGYYSLVTATKP
jgi:hypothetical protein